MFRALNKRFPPSRESSVNHIIDEIFQNLDGVDNMPKTDGSLDSQNHKYSIEHFGARRENDGVEEFEVLWSKTEVPRQFIARGRNNATVVRCDGRESEVQDHTRLRVGPDEVRLVEWKPSWLTREQLEAMGHVPDSREGPDSERPRKGRKRAGVDDDDEEETSTADGNPGSSSNTTPPKEPRQAPDGERLRKRRKRIVVEEDEEEASSTPADDMTGEASTGSNNASPEPVQVEVKEWKFQPMARIAYTDGVHKMLLKGASRLLGEMLQLPKRNHLVFRDRFVENGSFFNALERKCRAAAALQIAGEAQEKECEHCSKGNGPFDQCVIARGFLKGACANCAYGASATNCNYHVKSKAKGGKWEPKAAAKPREPPASAARELSPRACAIKRALAEKREQRKRVRGEERKNDKKTETSQESQDEEPAVDDGNAGPEPGAEASSRRPASEQPAAKVGKLKKPRKRGHSETTVDIERADGAPEGGETPSRRERERLINEPQASSPSQRTKRPAKPHTPGSPASPETPRVREQARADPLSGRIPAVSSPKTPEWQSDYLSADFRHEGCPPPPSPCTNFMVGCRSPESDCQPVKRDQIFKRGDASPQQVQWLIRRSNCCTTELMHRAWLHRLAERKISPLPKGGTKERFLSQWHPGKLTRAAAMFGTK